MPIRITGRNGIGDLSDNDSCGTDGPVMTLPGNFKTSNVLKLGSSIVMRV